MNGAKNQKKRNEREYNNFLFFFMKRGDQKGESMRGGSRWYKRKERENVKKEKMQEKKKPKREETESKGRGAGSREGRGARR